MLRPVSGFALLCAVTCLTAPLRAQQVADHIAMGIAAHDMHDLPTALRHFQAALAQDSSSYEANWRGAMTLLDLGEQIPDSVKSRERDSLYSQAEQCATRAVVANPNGADSHFALAAAIGLGSLTAGKKARIRRAGVVRKEALRAIELNPRHDGAYHILGRWNAEIMRISGFSRFFAKNFLGAGVFKQASWKNAIAYMEKAVELDPGRIYHHLELAYIYAERNRKPEAETELRLVESLPVREVMDSVYQREAGELLKRGKSVGGRAGRADGRKPS